MMKPLCGALLASVSVFLSYVVLSKLVFKRKVLSPNDNDCKKEDDRSEVQQQLKITESLKHFLESNINLVFLLKECGECMHHSNESKNEIGLPRKPLYVRLARVFVNWNRNGKCVFPKGVTDGCSVSQTEFSTTQENIVLNNLHKIMNLHYKSDKAQLCWEDLFKNGLISKRNIIRASVGSVFTEGSVEVIPPCKCVLLKSFQLKHKPKSTSLLTVGARALSKHIIRSEDSFWGRQLHGPETNRNKMSLEVINRIIDGCTHINCHKLPGEIVVLELRVPSGYGARWLADGSAFRGFLEPYMPNGHETKWRH
eukprot:TRINITY_DN12141_c0_g1_i1.p1 TRINITY_DN12141_c0_g1~~TRINITY_DN12141_c0_g1_i1.p1  ORF type:complete len:311 (+),score=52.86 TRINITY_DN12141_c0_g1_i1:28-960(+)